jgi:hypothetical protein
MSTTRGTTTKALVTGIAFMDTREINKGVIDVANEADFDDIMQLIPGGYKPTDQPNYHQFVNEDLLQVLVFDTGGVAGSGTATLTVTITTTGFARRGLKLKFANGKMGYINSVVTTASSKDSFTIKSVDGTNLTAVAADKVTANGIVMGEGSDEVQALTYGYTKYFNLTEHLKDKTEITDIQENSKVEINNGYYAYGQAISQAQSFKTQLSATFIGGIKSVNEFGTASPSIVDEYGGSMQTTGGLDQEIGSYGVSAAVATNDTAILSDVDVLLGQLRAVKAPKSYFLIGSGAAISKYDTLWKNMGSSDITSVRLDFNGKEIDFGVEKVTWGGFTLKFAALPIFDHPQLYNFAGASTIGKNLYGIPEGKVKVVGGGMEGRIRVRYMPNKYISKNQGTPYVREWYTGANNDNPTSGKEVKTCHISTTQGLECLGTRQMFKQRVLS